MACSGWNNDCSYLRFNGKCAENIGKLNALKQVFPTEIPAPADLTGVAADSMAFKNFYHADTGNINWGKGKPSAAQIRATAPAQSGDWTKDDSPHDVTSKDNTENSDTSCGWKQIEGHYLNG